MIRATSGLPAPTAFIDLKMRFGRTSHVRESFRLKNGTPALITNNIKLPDDIFWTLHQSNDGIMWFGSQSRGLVGYDGITYSNLDSRHGLIGNHVMSIHSDEKGNLWVGTIDGGLTQIDRKNRRQEVSYPHHQQRIEISYSSGVQLPTF